MTQLKNILDGIDNEETRIIHISNREDRKENKEYWRNYNKRLHRFSSDGYKSKDWYDYNEYIYNHCESDY